MVTSLIIALEGIGFSTAMATFAVNFAVSYVVTRMFADNPETQQDMGVRQQVPPSAVNAIPIVYGDAYMGGTFIDAVLSENQKAMYYVLALSSISPNGQFTFDQTDMYYGDRKITFDATDTAKVVSLTDEAGNVDTKINGYLWIGLYTSSQAGTITSTNWFAPSVVMGPTTPFVDYPIAAGQQWPASGRQMNGTAFAIATLIYSRDADTTQLQPITFKVKQALNGTGVAKAGDVWYDYMTNAVYGGAVDAAFVNSTSATALNAYGDQNITFTNSSGAPSTQPRYRINGVLDAGQSVLSNVDRIVSSCDSWMTYNAALGQWSVVINKAESTAYAFNDNNIIGEIRISATDITSSINQVEARFPFKNNRDQAAFVNIETPSGLLYPNEPVNKYSITYDMVNDSVQVHYLANRLLEQAREDLIVSFSTTYYGIQVDAGDVVSVTNSDYGWNAKLFRVMKVNEASLFDGSLGARLELSEYNAQVYDDQDITQFTPIPNSGLASASYFSPLSAPTVTGFPSATIPYINVQVFIPTTGRVTFANLFWTTSATPTAADWKLVSSASTTNGQPVTNNTYYTFANITLNTGTYYFAYIIGNDVTNSILSPISASLVWNPVAGAGPTGPTGSTGGSGDSVDIIFKRSATQPATPSPSVGTPATWYSDVNSVPAGTDPIWSSVGTNTGTGTNYTWQTPLLIEGQNGTDGLSVAELLIYIRATSTPSTPTGGSYNFTTQTLTPPSGWLSSVPTGTNPVYTSRSVASVQGTTGTDTTLTWSAPTLSFENGATGATGPTGTLGPTGTTGNSSRICYSKTTLTSLATTPTTITTSGNTSFPPNNSWGAGTVWGATAPAIVAGESVYQSDGVYSPSTNNTVWNVPYLSTLKVGQLSAITTNTGTLTIDTTGYILGGQTAYNTGTGFFLGYSGAAYKFSIGSIKTGTANVTTSVITSVAHGYANYAQLVFTNIGTITNISTIKIYSVINVTTDTFQISELFAGAALTLLGVTSTVTFTTQSLSWDGSALNITGNLRGGTIALGSGSAFGGYAFTVNEAGVVYVDNIFGGLGRFTNDNFAAISLQAFTSKAYEALVGQVTGTNASASAHGVRGLNSYNGTSGLIGVANGYDFYADGTGTNYGPFTGNHDILLPIDQTLTEGTLLVDVQCIARNGWSNAIFEVAPSTQANQAGANGIFVGELRPLSSVQPPVFIDHWEIIDDRSVPVMTAQYDAIKNNYWFGSMNSLGEGQIQVCGENGNISVDTLLVSSSTTGVAMAQTDDIVRGYTVAKAREAIIFTSPTDVKIVACIYISG
jgi:hypothetical protein